LPNELSIEIRKLDVRLKEFVEAKDRAFKSLMTFTACLLFPQTLLIAK
jgi:hypothetical protein